MKTSSNKLGKIFCIIIIMSLIISCKYKLIPTSPTTSAQVTIFEGTFVSVLIGDDITADGTNVKPYKTIQKAIDNAVYAENILVAAGTYNENIVLKDGVSIYGGYNSDWTARDCINRENSTYKTEIVPVSSSATVQGSNITSVTRVDGFTIHGHSFGSQCIKNDGNSSPMIMFNTLTSSGVGELSHYGVHNINSSPTIEYNIIQVGSSFTNYGIYNSGSSPTIRYNNIYGGAGSNSHGIYNANGGTPIVRYNNIHGGDGTSQSIGIKNTSTSTATITNNTINGGNSSDSNGLYNIDANTAPNISENYIHGGNSGNCTGVNENAGAKSIIQNNIVYTGDGTNTLGLNVVNGSASKVHHNTIIGGNTSSTVTGINITNTASKIENNIIFLTNGSTFVSIFYSGSPVIKNNNVFLAGTDSGNVTYGPSNIIGVNPNLDGNYAPQNSAVQTGGLDLRLTVPKDYYGNTRTLPITIGAVEAG